MTKQNIQNKLLEIKKNIERINDYLSEVEAMENELSDLTLEESQLELELAKIEEDELDYEDKPLEVQAEIADGLMHEEYDDHDDNYQLGN